MNQIFEEINKARTIGIAGHVRPDGDCTGSCIALYHYLRINQPEDTVIDLYLEPIPKSFCLLSDTDCIKQENVKMTTYDLFISLDCGSLDRLGFAAEYFEDAKRTMNIDHHISNTRFADVNHVIPDASSTCEILFDLFEEENIDLPAAEALYLGIIHDTGVFKHSNTSEKTMNIAGKLITKGVPFSKIIDETFYSKNYTQNQILGRCLLESMIILEGKCIVSSVSKKMLEFYNAIPSDLDGIIDQLRITQGIEVAILVYETNAQEYKVSMRSNNLIDVSRIASYFGGGGHVKAAGCTMHGSIHDVINNLTIHIEYQLHNQTKE